MFASFAFAEAPWTEVPPDLVEDWPEIVLYAATESFTTSPTDNPADLNFEGRLKTPLVFERSIIDSNEIGGAASIGLGEIELFNSDGALDDVVENYSIDGRRVRLLLGDPSAEFKFADFGTIFDGAAAGWYLTDPQTVRVKLRDWGYRLDEPIAKHYYGGTGGADGTDDFTGRPIQQCFGICRNVPVPIVDPLNGIIRFNDGPIEAVLALYDQGIELTPGVNYTVNLATGTGQLLLATYGDLTADVKGAKFAGTYASTTADIVLGLLRTNLGWDDADINLASFVEVKAAQPAEIGYFVNTDMSAVNVIIDLLRGIGGYYNFSRDGLLSIGILTLPVGETSAEFSAVEIIDISRDDPPAGLFPPTWKATVGYRRNWYVQTTGLAAGVSDDRKNFLRETIRYGAPAQDQRVKEFFLLAQQKIVDGYFDLKEDAEAEAVRLQALYGVPRWIYSLRLKTQPLRLDIGRLILAQYPRWTLGDGKKARIVRVRDDGTKNEVTLTVFA